MEAVEEKTVTVRLTDAVQAEIALSGVVDPCGVMNSRDMANAGMPFEFDFGDACAIASLEKKNGVMWIVGAAGDGKGDMTVRGLAAIEQIAIEANCHAVGFQTARAGLARKAKKCGYQVTGFILSKKVSNGRQ